MCFVWISEQTAIISLYRTNWLVFITENECVYCAVRTECLSIIPDFLLRNGGRWTLTLRTDTGLFEMIVGDSTTCHTQYTSDRNKCVFLFNRTTLQVFVTHLTGALYVHPL